MARYDDSLFETSSSNQEPLASRMRPRVIAEYIGQDHIMGPGRLLRRAIQADQLSSVIFSGPPGTGKTTLARVIAGSTKSDFISLNAVLAGVAEIREAIEKAKAQKSLYSRRTILFVDEVHRWNKSQQDALLPWVENGTFILIGATTENPYFEVNAALVSRSRVFQLKSLTDEDLRAIAAQALRDPLRGYGLWKVELEPAAFEHLVHTASGDARSLLNALELAIETTPTTWPPPPHTLITIDLAVAEDSIQQKALLYDREGDYHFDAISAFIKSLRGSDPDAALYWMARMVKSGESPRFVFRRMMISASEDIGLADPQALVVVQNAAAAFERVGMPEGQFFLAQAAIYLATAPKSNSTLAYFDALKVVEDEASAEVPNHLKDSSRDKKGFGHGEGYQYPHAFRDHWVAQNYLPQQMQGKLFYQPGELGHEGRLREEILRRRELQLAEASELESVENLSFSPGDKALLHFARRAGGSADPWLQAVRTQIFAGLGLARHHRVAIIGSESGFLVPEALRSVPEGLVYGLFARAQLPDMAQQLGQAGLLERCALLEWPLIAAKDTADPEQLPSGQAERLCAFNLLNRLDAADAGLQLAELARLSVPGAQLVLAEVVPSLARGLAAIVPRKNQESVEAELLTRVDAAERSFWATQVTEAQILVCLAMSWRISSHRIEELPRKRLMDAALIDSWLGSQRPGSWAGHLRLQLGEADFTAWSNLVRTRLAGASVDWPVSVLFIHAEATPSAAP